MRAITLLALAACSADESIDVITSEAEFCGSTSTELTTSADAKYQPVGFLNNGCTAFLIDAEHVVAAAHCFVFDKDGMFQPNLRFYPNYHPDRVRADANAVPHAVLDRAVVGSRVDKLHPWSDWGIAHVGQWNHITPAELTFATLDTAISDFPVRDDKPVPAEHVAYNRGRFPVTGPGMMFDDNLLCSWAPQWARFPETAPAGEFHGCNTRWMSGTIYSGCELAGVEGSTILHNCEVWGGSSGAPLFIERPEGPTVAGLTVGGPVIMRDEPQHTKCETNADCGPPGEGFFCSLWQCYQKVPNASAANAQCVARTDTQHNWGPATPRFLEAPRFASNVAVARRPDGTGATAVFGIDADRDQVVMRERLGDRPDHDAPFSYWQPLPRITEHQLSNIAACSDHDGHPMVVVTASQPGRSRLLRTRFDPNIGWLDWAPMDLPNAAGAVVDVDAAQDDDGSCLLFALDNVTKVIASTNLSNASWSDPVKWRTINTKLAATGTRLTSLRDDDGFLWIATLDDAGAMHALAKTCNDRTQVWFDYPVANRYGITRWRDLDLHWSDTFEGRLIAIPDDGDAIVPLVEFQLPRRTCGNYSNPDGTPAAPANDIALPVELWSPSSTTVVKPDLATVTASRWLEDPRGTLSPNIFATDRQGNVYMISNMPGVGWKYEWQSFYHEHLQKP